MKNHPYNHFLKWNIYQIYPRSFCDSNGDGIGDLNGITSRLNHLKALGIDAVWLSPCYQSPNDDNGYDIADYYDIMDEFGSLDDWKVMIKKMHELDIKLIMDLVPNHTSTAHHFFQESRKGKDNPYSDYYYWFDSPPNDWQAAFGGSAWQYDEVRKQYYLHSYAISQADLNWDNPQVRQAMRDIIDFWVDLGVDGFRIDVIDQISKDFSGHNAFGPHLHEYIRDMFGRDKVKHLFTVGECWVDSEEEIIKHCHPSRRELVTLFQFDHFDKARQGKFTLDKDSRYDLNAVKKHLVKWQNFTQKESLLYTLFTDNHDQPRFLSRMNIDKRLRYQAATMLATMFYLLKGVPFIYQGQEIGVLNSRYQSINSYRDIETLNFYEENKGRYSETQLLEMINNGSRDHARRPMPWDDSSYGGFSIVTPWIDVNLDYQTINVKNDKADEHSIFNYYQTLLKLRKDDVFIDGVFTDISDKRQDCFIYQRHDENRKVVVLINFEKEQMIDINLDVKQILLSNYDDLPDECARIYRPFEVVVYEIIESKHA